eukprot:3482881-Amphidinium_carterae.5
MGSRHETQRRVPYFCAACSEEQQTIRRTQNEGATPELGRAAEAASRAEASARIEIKQEMTRLWTRHSQVENPWRPPNH